LPTCSKCGNLLIAEEQYCNWCGTPVIQEEEPDDSPELSDEENTGPVDDQTSEQADEKIPEPDTDALPEENDEENIVPDEDGTPHHYKKEIQEPDTDELLEQFGADIAEDETLESYHKPKPLSLINHEAKKPVTVPAPRERGSSETVDDARFFSPGKPKAPAKPQVNKTRIIGGYIILIAIIAAVYFIGLPMLTGNGRAAEITPIPEPTIVRTISPTLNETPTPASRALIPQPTQLIPSGQKFPGTEKPNYFKDLGNFRRKCGA
jgi:hypothetical protein